MKYTAGFGPLGTEDPYRYTLGRDWTDELDLFSLASPNALAAQVALFLMLNPSTADAFKNDPTVAKCIRVARRLGYGGIEVRNIFAIRGTDPAILKQVADPIGPENDQAILSCATDPATGLIVAAWGSHGIYKNRASQVVRILQAVHKPIYCFAVTKQHQPVHPLYQREDQELMVWRQAA
jgi:hypothetical protein